MRATFLLSASPLITFIVSCSGADGAASRAMTNPAVPMGPSAIVTGSGPDMSGSWNWSAAGHLTVPASEVERLLGILPEGPITHVRCEGTGTMELSQTGLTFSGLATLTSRRCETGGGRVLELPTATFPNTQAVADGLITGRAVHFLLGAVAGLGCPHNGAIQDVVEGTATELRATGRCIIPGHPQSPVPRDPPPAGTSHDTSFVATRP
jgi:hypothetical protein